MNGSSAGLDSSNSSGKLYQALLRSMPNPHYFQTKVALDRIAVYLDEDEVSDQVSALKKLNNGAAPAEEDAVLGIENGSFKWNAVDETKEKEKADAKAAKSTKKSTKKSKGKDRTASASSEATVVAHEESASTSEAATEHQFELRDISVVFPDGKLSCITGPTASGKTALLVRAVHSRLVYTLGLTLR